jgi:peptidoglycan/LPS O-acetylase OafA/YrhL
MSRPPKAHQNNFDGLRLVGALMVVCSHQCAVAGRWEPRVVGGVSLGTLGVLLFFSISGFLVTRSWQHDPDLARFLLRRFLRVWPALAAVVLITLGLSYLLIPAAVRPPHLYLYLENLVFDRIEFPVFSSSPDPKLNASLWTITLEVRWYLILAVAAVFLKQAFRWGMVAAGAGGLVFYAVHGLQAGLEQEFARGRIMFLPYFGGFFVAGSLLALFPNLRSVRGLIVAGMAGAALLAAGQSYLGLVALVPLAAIFIGLKAWPVLRSAGRFGDFSYGIYLWAWPAEQLVTRWLGASRAYALLLAASLVAILPLAYLSWHAVERPCLKLKPRAAHPAA